MIIVADIDTWTTLANFTTLNGNGSFALNGTAYIVGQAGLVTPPAPPVAPPAASGAPTLSEWGIVILAALLIGAGTLRLARRSPGQIG
jgi:hypothetical protein